MKRNIILIVGLVFLFFVVFGSVFLVLSNVVTPNQSPQLSTSLEDVTSEGEVTFEIVSSSEILSDADGYDAILFEDSEDILYYVSHRLGSASFEIPNTWEFNIVSEGSASISASTEGGTLTILLQYGIPNSGGSPELSFHMLLGAGFEVAGVDVVPIDGFNHSAFTSIHTVVSSGDHTLMPNDALAFVLYEGDTNIMIRSIIPKINIYNSNISDYQTQIDFLEFIGSIQFD